MILVLDSGGVTALAGQRARLEQLLRRGLWPAHVPSIVLTESLTGDHRRDFPANRLLRTCRIRDVDEVVARDGARLRAATRRAGTISAVDAVVTALAATFGEALVLTTDPTDIAELARHTGAAVTVARV